MTRRIFQHNLKVRPELKRLLGEDRPVNPDQLAFKLARIATGLEADLHSVDYLDYRDRYASKQQKLQLIAEALDQVVQLVTPPSDFGFGNCFKPSIQPEVCRCGEYETCSVCLAVHSPASLMDHGG